MSGDPVKKKKKLSSKQKLLNYFLKRPGEIIVLFISPGARQAEPRRSILPVMDKITPQQRSRNMAQVKGKDTKPEKLVRSLLHGMGYRFWLHVKTLPGKPDIALPRYKAVIFVHGCFWHGHEGCRLATIPATRTEFWAAKIGGNKTCDRCVLLALKSSGIGF
jgi:DNA mismatch endonuclease (patch repair protein)